jgi:purine-binding chemotaxis protein CheW
MSLSDRPAAGKREIFRKRAEMLASRTIEKPWESRQMDVVEFRLAHEKYALESLFVKEIVLLKGLTPIPCTPVHVRGIINVRGRIFSVMDLRVFFDLPGSDDPDSGRVILLSSRDMELGILADSVEGFKSIPLDQVRAGLPTLTGIRQSYLRGVAGEDLVILDAGKLLADRSIVVNEKVE